MKIPTALLLLVTCLTTNLLAQTEPAPRQAEATVLEDGTWKQVDASVKRGTTWLATQQREDGSFNSIASGQPAITSFCLMAFMAQGESPSEGRYQKQLAAAIDFIAAQQKPNGLIAATAPSAVPIPRGGEHETVGGPSVYNHAISGLALSEAYGQCNPDQAKRLAPIIEKAIAATLEMQGWVPNRKKDQGGWRYLDLDFGRDSDLSVTGWQLMFLRSAKNAGFEVPKKSIDAAVGYVENCFLKDKDRRVHGYLAGSRKACTRAMAGAGVLALAHAGKHDSKEALASAHWILKHDFKEYNTTNCIASGSTAARMV